MPSKKHPGNPVRDTSKQKSKPNPKPKSKPPNPSNTPPKHPLSYPTPSSSSNPQPLPIKLQQSLLNIFSTAFSSRLSDPSTLKEIIQKVKGHLYDRDFASAFADEEGLEAYAVRWSAGRAVAYLHLFCDIDCIHEILKARGANDESKKILCLGGGAGAEVVALACVMRQLSSTKQGIDFGKEGREVEDGVEGKWEVVIVDCAAWGGVLGKLDRAVTEMAEREGDALSSQADPVGERSTLLGVEKISVGFLQRDALAMGLEEMGELCERVSMVTLMFTLNELYSISAPKTTRLLLDLTRYVERGCLLVVVDSPGSYSSLALKKTKDAKSGSSRVLGEGEGADDSVDEKCTEKGEKRYPMQWLLDHTLLKVATRSRGTEGRSKGEREEQWEKVHSEDSRWFRLREELRYPIALEDTRMQVHIYRKV
ncbi:MAG: hypothetical protein Q9166_003723 [cf. Caloplaca sp. 2 TL-2023]